MRPRKSDSSFRAAMLQHTVGPAERSQRGHGFSGLRDFTVAQPSIWRAAERITTLFMCAAVDARTRMLDHSSSFVRLMNERDRLYAENALLERELAIFRSQRLRKEPKERPHFVPEERAEILQVMRLRGWSPKKTAERFGVHPNTIRNWMNAVDDKLRAKNLLGGPPWNKAHESVRWLVREMRCMFPEPEFGSRTIARHIARAGIKLSRTSVRRILQEHPTNPTKKHPERAVTQAPDHVQHPEEPNKVWHLDITTVKLLWWNVEIAALLDGFSRKLVALKAFKGRVKTADLPAMIEAAIQESGATPRFIVTDHGSQFRREFRNAVSKMGVTHVRCQVHTWQLNAKVERVFRDIKAWAAKSVLSTNVAVVQQQLDAYREWHNRFRPHAAHDTLTPLEVEAGTLKTEAVSYRQKGGVEPVIQLERRHVSNDRRLCYPVIHVRERREAA